MSRKQADPLRGLRDEERNELERLSRSRSAPAAHVARARALLAVAAGESYTVAAHLVGRQNGDTVRAWVSRFNRDGGSAEIPQHGGGPPVQYLEEAQQRILALARRAPDRAQDGTATWSLSTLQTALRRTEKSWAAVSTYTIWNTLHRAGLSWQQSRTWCETGVAVRARKHDVVEIEDIDATPKKKLIERAYALPRQAGVAVWCEDEAGPFQAVPQAGRSWQRAGHPATQPHDWIRGGAPRSG